MKKILLSVFALTFLLFTACKKDKTNPKPEDSSYQPFSAGSTWKYRIVDDGEADADTVLNTMTAATKTFNGKTFHVMTTQDLNPPPAIAIKKLKPAEAELLDESYIGFNNNIYSTFFQEDEPTRIEIGYLNLNKEVGESWIEKISFTEEDVRIEGQAKVTIIAKGLTKTLHSKTYTNVINSKVELQAKTGNTYATKITLNFFIAKNIGIISTEVSMGGIKTLSELIDYNIK